MPLAQYGAQLRLPRCAEGQVVFLGNSVFCPPVLTYEFSMNKILNSFEKNRGVTPHNKNQN